MGNQQNSPVYDQSLWSYLKSKKGWVPLTICALSVILAMFHFYTSLTGPMVALRHRPFHVLVMCMIVFLSSSVSNKNTAYLAWNSLLSLLCLGILLYMVPLADILPMHVMAPTDLDMVLGTLSLALVLEATRRTVGGAMAVIAIIFILYTWLGNHLPGAIQHAGYSWEEIIAFQFLENEGLWGIPVATMSTFIIIFLLFAGFMVESGMLKVFVEIAFKLVGRQTGGPAKATVVASAVVGSLSGSAAADTLIVGSAMVPAMLKVGYDKDDAGAIQAGAGTGAQFMPPIMGAAAFIIAAYLGVPYILVCKGALMPALMYFFSYAVAGHFIAQKMKIKPLSDEEMAKYIWRNILPKLYMLFPIALIIGLLIIGYSPLYAGFYSIVSVLVLAMFRKETRFTPVRFLIAIEHGVKASFTVSIACATAGIVVGAIMQSGLGFMLSGGVTKLAMGELYLLVPLAMFVSLLLGFGMTTVGVYIIVSTLVTPAMIDMGVAPMAAHLFPFYFGCISAITPPVAVASYSVCGLTDGNPWRTGLLSLRYCAPAMLVPIAMIWQPGFILDGPLPGIIMANISGAVGIILLSAASIGYFNRPLPVTGRLILAVLGCAMFFPYLSVRLGILALTVLFYLWQGRQAAKEQPV